MKARLSYSPSSRILIRGWLIRVTILYHLLLLIAPDVSAKDNTTSDNCIPFTFHIPKEVTHRPHKLVIAHRGASFHLPEHTLEAYRLALDLGADYVEPDLVASSDGVLVALHTVDLNATTNVMEVFPNRDSWFSPTANRSGYWSFNFTWDEIAQLRVRQRLPAVRSTAYDGLWGVPRLEDIVAMIHDWNTVTLPATRRFSTSNKNAQIPQPLDLAAAGVYLELKDAEWLQDEAGIVLVDLFMEHLSTHNDLWSSFIPCYRDIHFDEFRLPPLVIESFSAEALQSIHDRWQDEVPGTMPEPPYVLLVDHKMCSQEGFWFLVGDDLRAFLSGLGLEKTCLLSQKNGLGVQQKALEFGLFLHPWTSRPEIEEFDSQFDSVEAEIEYLLCERNAQAVFTESVVAAVQVTSRGCDPTAAIAPNPAPPTDTTCSEESVVDEPEVVVGLASFLVGALVMALLVCYWGQRKRQRGDAVSTTDLDVEMT